MNLVYTVTVCIFNIACLLAIYWISISRGKRDVSYPKAIVGTFIL